MPNKSLDMNQKYLLQIEKIMDKYSKNGEGKTLWYFNKVDVVINNYKKERKANAESMDGRYS